MARLASSLQSGQRVRGPAGSAGGTRASGAVQRRGPVDANRRIAEAGGPDLPAGTAIWPLARARWIGSLIETPQPFYRDRAGRAFNVALRLATGLPFLDTQCGFKAFRMSVCRQILESATVDGFGFDVELLFVAHRAGLRLRRFRCAGVTRRAAKYGLSRDGPRMLADIAIVRRQMWAGHYDPAMIAATGCAARSAMEPSSGTRHAL